MLTALKEEMSDILNPISCGICGDMMFFDNSYVLPCTSRHKFCRKCLCAVNICLPPRTYSHFECPLCPEYIRWPIRGLEAFAKIPRLNDIDYLKQQLLYQYNILIEEKIKKIEYLMTRPVIPEMEKHNRELRKQIDNSYLAKINQMKTIAEEVELWDGYPFQDSIESMRKRLRTVISQNLLSIMIWKRSLYMYRIETLEGLQEGLVLPQTKYFFQFRHPIKAVNPRARKFFVLTYNMKSIGSVFQLPYESHIEPDLIISKEGLINMDVCKKNDKIMILRHDSKTQSTVKMRVDTVSTASGGISESCQVHVKSAEFMKIISNEDNFCLVSGGNIYKKEKSKKVKQNSVKLEGKYTKAIGGNFYYLAPEHSIIVTDSEFKCLRKRQMMICNTSRSNFSFIQDVLRKLREGFHFVATGRHFYIINPCTFEGKAYETAKVFGTFGYIECNVTNDIVTFFIISPFHRERVMLYQFVL